MLGINNEDGFHFGKGCLIAGIVLALVLVPNRYMCAAEAMGMESTKSPVALEQENNIPKDMLPNTINSAIPDDATVVSKDLAVTQHGDIKSIGTGKLVTDTTLVGTPDHPADPLAKTSGRSFIPTSLKEVKKVKEVDDAGESNAGHFRRIKHDDSKLYTSKNKATYYFKVGLPREAVVPAALTNNEYGSHWGTYNGTQAFFESDGTLFAQQAKGVIDVSQWQGNINWEAVRSSGVEGAIIRIGYGWGNGPDLTAERNIRECKRLGIPFGIYLYSYAYDANTGRAEGDSTVNLLHQLGVNPADLAYPVFYDLEQWAWTDHTPPSSPLVYDGIVNSWYDRLQSAGYNNLSVYSYTFYLNTALNSNNIRSKTSWVASYGRRTGFNFATNFRCWQYADNGRINGINGDTDLNACGYKDSENEGSVLLSPNDRLTDITEGDYYIGSALNERYLDIAGGSHEEGLPAQIWSPNNGNNQLFHVKPVGKGTYSITSKNSGKALDVRAGSMQKGNSVIQYTPNSGINQLWSFYKTKDGYVNIVSALGDGKSAVLDVTGGNTTLGTQLEIWVPNGGQNQSFRLMQAAGLSTDRVRITNSFSHGNSMDVPGLSRDPETQLQTWLPNGGDNQLFTFVDRGNGRYIIKVAHSNMYLDIKSGYREDGGAIIQFPLTGGDNQLWYLQKYHNGFALRSVSNNKAIDISGMNTAPGAALISYTFLGQANQLWEVG